MAATALKHLAKKYVKYVKVGEDVVNVMKNAPIDEKALTEMGNSKLDGYYGLALARICFKMDFFVSS